MYVRLTCKLAEVMEGVDLSAYAEGDIVELDEHDASLMIKGGWAEPVREGGRRSHPVLRSNIAADRSS